MRKYDDDDVSVRRDNQPIHYIILHAHTDKIIHEKRARACVCVYTVFVFHVVGADGRSAVVTIFTPGVVRIILSRIIIVVSFGRVSAADGQYS